MEHNVREAGLRSGDGNGGVADGEFGERGELLRRCADARICEAAGRIF